MENFSINFPKNILNFLNKILDFPKNICYNKFVR